MAGRANRRWMRAAVMTHGEYRANINGLNIFFGAVLGFVMAGTESLEAWRYALVLLFVSGIVVSILYITASPHRLLYALLTVTIVAALPFLMDGIVGDAGRLPEKLQPTLAVWTLMTAGIEFLPREKPTLPAAPSEEP